MKYILTLFLGFNLLSQEVTKPANRQKPTGQSFSWYQGGVEKKVVVMKDMVAEIGNSNRTMSKEYKILEERPGVVFWKVEDENIKLELNKGNLPRSLGSNFSPVFKSGPARMTLPGGVILFFKNGVDGVKWISAKGLEVKQKLNYGNAYLIKSSPGLPSLELANSLKDDPDIDSAEPNWWREVRLK